MNKKLLITLGEIFIVWIAINGAMQSLIEVKVLLFSAGYWVFIVSSIIVVPVLIIGLLLSFIRPAK